MTEIIFAIMAVSLLLYVLLGGADFGGGIIELFSRGKAQKIVSNAIAPVWEANHVWLILVVVILFVGFPGSLFHCDDCACTSRCSWCLSALCFAGPHSPSGIMTLKKQGQVQYIQPYSGTRAYIHHIVPGSSTGGNNPWRHHPGLEQGILHGIYQPLAQPVFLQPGQFSWSSCLRFLANIYTLGSR
jgi:hypothetical protein